MRPVFVTLLILGMATGLSAKSPTAEPRLVALKALNSDVGTELRARAADVVLIAPRESVTEQAGKIGLSLGTSSGLCDTQPFADERGVDMACTGVLVSTGLVLTAAHCLDHRDIEDWVVVFGHHGHAKVSLRSARIKAIRHCVPNDERGDLVALELEEALEPASPAQLAAPQRGDRVHLLGHPFGWTLKASTCIGLRHCDNYPTATEIGVDWFLADLDAFGGNSGSPVYSADGKSLVGIWSGGPTMLERSDPKVRTSCKIYPTSSGKSWGGKATRVDKFMASVTTGTSLNNQCRKAP